MTIDEFIRNIPKAELNIHIEGTLEPEMLFALAEKNQITLPYASVEEARKAYHFTDSKSFLAVYYANVKVLVTEQDFYDLTWAYLQKAAAQKIRHAEVFFDPQAHLERGIKFETVINGMYRAIREAQKQFNMSASPILCFRRDLSEESAQKVFDMALDYKEWIIAVGLDSSELGNPPEKFKEVFARAREQGFLTVAIAGETGGPAFIWQAMDILKVSRIDHGVRCMEDPDLVAKLSATQIPLDIAPVANVKLGLFRSMREHPLKKMYEQGVFVTVNSDDPAYFNASLNDNFIAANAALKLNKTIIYELAKNSFNASFLSHEDKEKYLSELEKFYKQASKET